MKDYLQRHKWVNNPLKNPYTMAMMRFKKQPWGLLKTPFMEDRLKFDNKLNTRYTELIK